MVFKKLHKRSFLGGTAAHSLQQHPFEADSATRPSQAGFFIKDELSDYRFLVDTGAFRSILPPPGDINTINHPSSSDLVAANGTSIRTYGEQQVNIRLSGQAYTWTFIIADVRHPLLGADFLSHCRVLIFNDHLYYIIQFSLLSSMAHFSITSTLIDVFFPHITHCICHSLIMFTI